MTFFLDTLLHLLLLLINSWTRTHSHSVLGAILALTLIHINAPNCSYGWSTSALDGLIYVRVYTRTETDCIPSSTNAFTNLFSSIIDLCYNYCTYGKCSCNCWQIVAQLQYTQDIFWWHTKNVLVKKKKKKKCRRFIVHYASVTCNFMRPQHTLQSTYNQF